MVDFTHPRHAVGVMAECDEDQAELSRFFGGFARNGYTKADGTVVPPDPEAADKCDANAEVFEAAAKFMREIHPDVPRTS